MKKEFENLLHNKELSITDFPCARSSGKKNDYYSEGPYWHPNPDTADGLPYIRRDGVMNKNIFLGHKNLLLKLVHETEDLYEAYSATGDERFKKKVKNLLYTFFIDKEKRMTPSLSYAQAIPGICHGRYTGLIDTLQFIDLPIIIEKLGLREIESWFNEYSAWLYESEFGKSEGAEDNNHAIIYYVQLAAFSRFSTKRKEIHEYCFRTFQERLLKQVALDGSMPEELKRTKPYAYSILALDNLTTLAQLLEREYPEIWTLRDDRGVGLETAIRFLAPFLLDKKSWPYREDIEGFDTLPSKASFLLFAARAYGISELERLYEALPSLKGKSPAEDRHVAVKNALLYL